jgi:hypothetical protein
MNTIREDIAQLLPGLAEQELSDGRRRRLEEFVMSQIQSTPTRRRRPVFLAVATTSIAVVAVAATVAVAVSSSQPTRGGSVPRAAVPLSGQQVLLAAAVKAEQAPATSGTYWYVKTVTKDEKTGKPLQWETWTGPDGREWFRGQKTHNKVVEWTRERTTRPYYLGGHKVSLAEMQQLPATPEALKAWIANAIKNDKTIRTSAGRPDAKMQEQMVLDGLMGLVSALPASPKVRAAAFRAIAGLPGVRSVGAVNGGQALQVYSGDAKVRLVVDPATGRVRETNTFVTIDGGNYFAPGGATITTAWTNTLPR